MPEFDNKMPAQQQQQQQQQEDMESLEMPCVEGYGDPNKILLPSDTPDCSKTPVSDSARNEERARRVPNAGSGPSRSKGAPFPEIIPGHNEGPEEDY